MNDLDEYKKNIRIHGMMCGQYGALLDSFSSNKQLADIAMGVQAFDTICVSIANGWGISPEYICARLKNFINGKYVSEQKGYKSKMYFRFKGDVTSDTSAILLIDCDVDLRVPNWSISEIYCVGKCNINVTGSGRVVFICYGHPNDIVITGSCGNMKRIDKKEADANG